MGGGVQGGVRGEICPETAERGGQAGGRIDVRAGEAEGNHRGAGADLRRDVRLLNLDRKWIEPRDSVCGSGYRIMGLSRCEAVLHLCIYLCLSMNTDRGRE